MNIVKMERLIRHPIHKVVRIKCGGGQVEALCDAHLEDNRYKQTDEEVTCKSCLRRIKGDK